MPVQQATAEEVCPARRPYRPLGAALKLMTDRSPEILLSGPAGTGKTRAVLEKLHLCAERYPGMRGLIVRKTRASLTESALVTWEDHVIPEGHAILDGAKRPSRKSYSYPNGSTVVVGGLDRPTRIMSTEYSFVYVQEAIELSEAEWEALTSRLRHPAMPYRQIVGDTNPDRPGHWLKQRCDHGACKMLDSRHDDNPSVTAEYLDRLDQLTGPRKLRLRYGRWVQAEGVVYTDWDSAIHLIDPFEIPGTWPRFWSIDFGFTNAFACLCCAMDGDGRLYVYRQIYHTKKLVTQHAERMRLAASRQGRPSGIVADSEDREGRETLAAEGFTTVASIKGKGSVQAGIQAVQARLRPAGDGRPRLYVFRDSLDELDPELAAAKRATCLQDEVDGYVWHNKGRDEPAPNQDDHACDAIRQLIFALDAPRRREEDDDVVTVYVA